VIKSQPAHIVNRVSFEVDRVHNQMISMVYGRSHGSDEEYWIKLRWKWHVRETKP